MFEIKCSVLVKQQIRYSLEGIGKLEKWFESTYNKSEGP